MVCPKCQNTIERADLFCGYCGNRVKPTTWVFYSFVVLNLCLCSLVALALCLSIIFSWTLMKSYIPRFTTKEKNKVVTHLTSSPTSEIFAPSETVTDTPQKTKTITVGFPTILQPTPSLSAQTRIRTRVTPTPTRTITPVIPTPTSLSIQIYPSMPEDMENIPYPEKPPILSWTASSSLKPEEFFQLLVLLPDETVPICIILSKSTVVQLPPEGTLPCSPLKWKFNQGTYIWKVRIVVVDKTNTVRALTGFTEDRYFGWHY